MTRLTTILAMLLTFHLTATAQPAVDAKVKAQAQGFLKRMAEIEKKAAAVEPMHIPLQGRTRAQDQEMTKRIEFLDNLRNKEVAPLLKDVNRAQLPAPLTPVREAAEALDQWTSTKLSLQNAGVNNPSLASLKKSEPVDHKAFQEAYQKAVTAAK